MITVGVAAGTVAVSLTAENVMKFVSGCLRTFANNVNSTRFAKMDFTIEMNLLRFVVFQSNVSDECAVS